MFRFVVRQKKILSVPWGIKKYKWNDKRFNNHDYSLFFLMGIFLRHVIDSKYITMTGLQDFNEASFFTDPSRSSHQMCFIKKVFLKICDISEETLLKRACNFIKKKLKQRCFLVKFVKFLRTPILKNIYKRVLLPFLGFRKLNHNVFPFSFMETSLFCNNIINC